MYIQVHVVAQKSNYLISAHDALMCLPLSGTLDLMVERMGS